MKLFSLEWHLVPGPTKKLTSKQVKELSQVLKEGEKLLGETLTLIRVSARDMREEDYNLLMNTYAGTNNEFHRIREGINVNGFMFLGKSYKDVKNATSQFYSKCSAAETLAKDISARVARVQGSGIRNVPGLNYAPRYTVNVGNNNFNNSGMFSGSGDINIPWGRFTDQSASSRESQVPPERPNGMSRSSGDAEQTADVPPKYEAATKSGDSTSCSTKSDKSAPENIDSDNSTADDGLYAMYASVECIENNRGLIRFGSTNSLSSYHTCLEDVLPEPTDENHIDLNFES